MNDTNKIRLIKAYSELLKVVAENGNKLKENLNWKYGDSVGYRKVKDTVDHLSQEIQKLTFNKDAEK